MINLVRVASPPESVLGAQAVTSNTMSKNRERAFRRFMLSPLENEKRQSHKALPRGNFNQPKTGRIPLKDYSISRDGAKDGKRMDYINPNSFVFKIASRLFFAPSAA
jgi:hypothetical protein